MKTWLDNSKAHGGGDTPEAVADALNSATMLSWNTESTKISIMVSDAPPHALDPSMDSSFHNGCPNEHDPMKTVRELAKLGITLYTVGVEPSINRYKDFFEALAVLTGGQYVHMRNPYQLIDVIIGGAEEELSLNKFTSERLNTQGVKSKHLTKNSKALEGPSVTAKLLADLSSMADVRGQLGNGIKSKRRGHGRRLKTTRVHYGRPPMKREDKTTRYVSSSDRRRGSSYAHLRSSRPKPEFHKSSYVVRSRYVSYKYVKKGHSGALSHVKPSREKFSTVESSVSLDQIKRLVKKETSRLK
ncbi:unnamed protein product [Mytilus edulis]|uniref:VWFA domain-containing protein n=1 Tax=Mytilus edulis TaxID=6550 RepID=A0A8S3UKH5_MYTED|nr:unnamed protein product [Mytilus edulis]